MPQIVIILCESDSILDSSFSTLKAPLVFLKQLRANKGLRNTPFSDFLVIDKMLFQFVVSEKAETPFLGGL